jgi:hypothetical protein
MASPNGRREGNAAVWRQWADTPYITSSAGGQVMREIIGIRQEGGALRKRWFTDSRCDLFVWMDAQGRIVRFQLCYDKPAHEHVLDWREGVGVQHGRVDDGEVGTWWDMTPIIVADGAFDAEAVVDVLRERAAGVPAAIVEFVAARLL